MFALTDVFNGPGATGLLQLLLAFVACMAYLLAQGRLLGTVGRRRAALGALASVAGFVAMDRDWAGAIVLVAFAVAALGLFAAMAWLTAKAIGMGQPANPRAVAGRPERHAAMPARARRAAAGGAPSATRQAASRAARTPPPAANDTAV